MNLSGAFDFTQNPPVEGLRYIPGFLDRRGEERLAGFIDGQPWRDDLKRRVQHYGYVYDYRARQISRGIYLGQLPRPFAALAEALLKEAGFDRLPDQVIVNEYLPGQGIAPHTDCIPCFGETIASASLLSASEMEFLHPPTGRREALLLKPRSLLILSGPARYEWQHTIRPRKADMAGGTRLPRSRRLSLTFRKVKL